MNRDSPLLDSSATAASAARSDMSSPVFHKLVEPLALDRAIAVAREELVRRQSAAGGRVRQF